MKNESASRRKFLQQLSAAAVGTALTGTMAETLAAQHKPKPLNDYLSDKKFVPVMVTPFQKNGTIDYEGLSKLIDFYLSAGVKGFFANCLSSEMYNLSEAERLSLVKHVVKRVNGKMPVVATGSFGDSLQQRADFTKRIYATGANAVILITSHFVEENQPDEVLMTNFERFLQLTENIPLGTYECPAPYKRIITPTVFKYMLNTNRFIYHKDTTIDIEKVKEKIALVRDNRLEFYDACVANTSASLQAGAKGMSAICGNFYPDVMVWMCNHANDPQRSADLVWMQQQLTITEDIIGQNYPQSAKYFLQKRGVPINTISRTATTPLSQAQMKILDETYQLFLGWCTRLGIQPAKI
jgi:4-hydroxy-tetrahydrodipicolinate synthase